MKLKKIQLKCQILLTEVSDDELAKENCEEMLEFLKEELKSKSGSVLKYIRNLESEKEIVREENRKTRKI